MSTSFPTAGAASASPAFIVEGIPPVAPVSDREPSDAPLDFHLITSRTDFGNRANTFTEAFTRLGIRAEVTYIEDVAGMASGDKLTALFDKGAAWRSSGKIANETIKVVLLHGGMGNLPPDSSLDKFCRESMGTQESQPDAQTHIITAAHGRIAFPIRLLDAALRSITIDGSETTIGFSKTIIYCSCYSAVFRDEAKKTGGDYVFAIGKKSGIADDFEACLLNIIDACAERKRQHDSALTARDCWSLMQGISGEHVSFVGDDTLEINKVIRSGHSEPALVTLANCSDDQAMRILFAKLSHGSAKSIQQIIDTRGPAILTADHSRLFPRMSPWSAVLHSDREVGQKAKILLLSTPGLLHKDGWFLTSLHQAIDKNRRPAIAALFSSLVNLPPLALSLEQFIFWARKNPGDASKLHKACRENRDISNAVGDYLLKATEDPSSKALSPSIKLPEVFIQTRDARARRIAQARAQ